MSIEKFKLNKEFKRVYGRGKSFVSPYVVTYYLKDKSNSVRIGITAGKKLGNAVCRNRAKRLISAAFREVSNEIIPGSNIVFVARTRILSTKSTVVAQEIQEHLNKAGALINSR